MASSTTKQTVLITGCSAGGIGDAVAQSFHRRGFYVFATARNLERVEHLKDLGMTVLQLDVADEASLKRAVEVVTRSTGGRLDFLVNNSGCGYSGPALDVDIGRAKKLFDVNFFGRVAVAQAFAPLLITAKGTIINIGSIAGECPMPWQSIYNASMAGVNMWSDILRMEMEPLGVKVLLVVAGAVATNFIRNMSPAVDPESLYAPAKSTIDNVMNGGKAPKSAFHEASIFAEKVVGNVVNNSPKQRLWVGGMSSFAWFFLTFFPATTWDGLLRGQFGINELRKQLSVNEGTNIKQKF